MQDAVEKLKSFKPKHEFLIAIDSDGCAFDTMELKHKECFIPNIIHYWGLQPISKFARAAAEFVNLYSVDRGANRFPALITAFDLLKEWDRVKLRNFEVPKAPNLRRWIKEETKLGNPVLEKYCTEHPEEEDMQRALAWSKAVNRSVDEIVGGGLPPFPFVRECLEKAGARADMMVCSQTPTEALQREWEEQGVAGHVFQICGQEVGRKAEHIQFASAGRFEKTQILMIGDALGDLKAAESNDALFFPINPGEEDTSWQRLYEEGLERFFGGSFAGEYQAELIERFREFLPSTPPWQV